MTKEDNKPKTQSGTPAGTGKTPTGANLEELIKAYASMGGVVNQDQGPTAQDAEAAVQNVYTQMLGRNAAGAERSKAINAYLNQAIGTDASGRQQAIISLIQQSPEYRKRQENDYLDAIYNEVAKNVQRTQR